MDPSSSDDPPLLLQLILSIGEINFVLYLAEILAILALLVCSALISGSEVAYFSLTTKQLNDCRNSQSGAERNIALLLDDPKHLLAIVLILNNLVNVAIVTISTHLMLTWVSANQADVAVATLVLTIIITFSIVFFGEVIPKVYSNQRALYFAKITSGAMLLASHLFAPLAWALLQMGDLVEQNFKRKGYHASVEELNDVLDLTATDETTEEEKDILRGIVNFGTITVKQIMRSRLDITAFDIDTSFHELIEGIIQSGYSRIPVYNSTIDKIEGILYIKDIIPHLKEPDSFLWQDLIHRDVFYVPEGKKIDQLLKDFQARRVHVAIVVDEYGGTSGLVTLEDIIEEIVGEINDEFDTRDVVFRQIDHNTYAFEGKTSLNDFCKLLDLDPNIFNEVKGDSESLGGLLLELFSRMPRAGEKKRFRNFVFTVMSVDTKRIKNVRVHLKNTEDNHENS